MGTSDRHTCKTCGSELTWIGSPDEATLICLVCATVDNSAVPQTPGPADESPDGQAVGSTRIDAVITPGDAIPLAEQETRVYNPSGDSVSDLPRETIDYQRQSPREPGGDSPGGARVTVIGRFVIKKVLGQGAFGTVYRAFDPLLDREVALKVPRFVDGNRATEERFLREAKSAARLRHPNVVAVFESGHADGHPYIAAEFVDGTPLSQLLAENPDLDMRRGVEWVRQIAEAIHYAHSEGVIHRDIKPANIMVNAAGRPQVMDFGLAKRTADDAAHMTVEGTILGTPAFMAPEQARGEMSRVGPASDQYSVGVILFTILCGRMPYQGDAWSIMSRVGNVNEPPPKPRSIRPTIPEDLEASCLKAMEKDAGRRYADLSILAEDLKRWLEGRPLIARPIGPSERFVRWCRRNRLIASLSGSLVALLIIATIVGFVLAYQFQDLAFAANQETIKANKARSQETETRRELERLLVDNYTENGLGAARLKDNRQAVLWFAKSAILAKNFPTRREHNLVRYAAWLNQSAIPAYAFNASGYFCKSLRYHPSSRYLMVESLAWDCEIHDLQTQTRLQLPQSSPIVAARWNSNGKVLALASNNTVSLYDFPQLKLRQQWSHPDAITVLSWHPRGNQIAVGGDKGFRLYNIADPATSAAITELGSRLQAVQFNQDSTRLAVATEDKRLRVYQLTADNAVGEQVLPTQEVATEGTEVLFDFVAEDRLVLIDNNREVRCWDFKKGAIAWQKPVGRVICIDVSPDGKRLAYESLDSSYKHLAYVLDALTGQSVGAKVEHRNHILSLDWNRDGKRLLACSGDHSASVTDMESGKPVIAVVPHNGFVLRGVWAPDGKTFATAHWHDRLVRVWKLPGVTDQDYLAHTDNTQGFVKTSHDGRSMILTGFDTLRTQREIQVRDIQTGAPTGAKITPQGAINDAVFLATRKILVTGGSAGAPPDNLPITRKALGSIGTIQFWNQEIGEVAFPAVPTVSEPVAVACDPAESTVVVLCDGGQLHLLDAATGKLRRTIVAFSGPFTDKGFVIRDRLRFSPDGRLFAAWGFGFKVQLRDAKSGDLVHDLRHKEGQVYIHDVRFSPRGGEMASCSSDDSVIVWDVKSGRPIETLQHTGWVFNAQFNQAGDRLLTASSDRQARLWDWKNKIMLASTLEQDDQVYGVAFAPDETMFVTSSRDGTVGAWEATTGKQVAPLHRFQDMVYQVEIDRQLGVVLAAGRIGGIGGLHIKGWLKPPEFQLPDEDLLTLAEIISNQQILKTSVAANLTTEEWYSRWGLFQKKYPNHPVFQFIEN